MDKKVLNNLILQIQKGNDDAFEKLYEVTNKSIFTFVYSFVKRKDIAIELTQDTFIKIKRFAYLYKPNTNALAWILQIAKNISIDHLKKYKAETSFDNVAYELVDTRGVNIDTKLVLHDLINKYLLSDERQIILLHDVYGYKNREIAQFMSLPLGTVLWKYNKAIKLLRKKYKEEIDEN